MGHLEVVLGDGATLHPQHVHVEGARAPADLPHAPGRLLEALAEHVAATLMQQDARIAAVTVALRKLRPPVAQQLSTSGVRITRGQ